MESSTSITTSIMSFMPQFILHMDPIIHHSELEGRRMTENQTKVMMMLHHGHEASPGVISGILNIPKGSLTTVLKSLRQIGYISRRADDADERSYKVALTQEGSRFVKHHVNKCHRELHRLFAEMTDDDQHTAVAGLYTIEKYLRQKGKGP